MSQPQPPGVVEADQFCPCNYKLHGQRVTIDERLGFPVVRCPECGRFSPAGHGSTATRAWLRRLAAVLLLAWVLLLVGVAAVVTMAAFGLQMAHFQEHTTWAMIDPLTGRVVEEVREPATPRAAGRARGSVRPYPANSYPSNPYGPQTQTSFVYVYRYADTGELVPLPEDPPFQVDSDGERYYPGGRVAWPAASNDPADRAGPTWRTTVGFALSLAAAGLLLGVLQAATLYHLRRAARLLPPLVVGTLTAGIFLMVALSEGWLVPASVGAVWRAILAVAGSLVAGWSIGLFVGRPVARGLARLLVPPGPRRALGHLWYAGGR